MLKATPGDLCEELKAAEDYRKRLTNAKDKMVARYVGPYFDERRNAEEAPENFYHEYSSYLLPRLAFKNPRYNVRSRRVGPHQKVSKALGHGLNRWCVDSNLRKCLIPAATDYLFQFTMLLTTQDEARGGLHPSIRDEWGDKKPQMPRVSPLLTSDCYFDPLGRTPEEWRYVGHSFVRDQDDLVGEAEQDGSDWDLDAVKALSTEVSQERQKRRDDIGFSPDRGGVELIEVWVPEHWDEDEYDSAEDAAKDGYHGMIYTLSLVQGVSQNPALRNAWIRKPRAFYGPRWGPYTYIGCYPVPGEGARMSPLVAVEAQNRALNRLAKAEQRGAEDFKTLGIYNGDDPKVKNLIASAPHHSFLGLPNFDRSQIGDLSVGGNHPELKESVARAKDRLDRVAGLGEAQRGATTSGSTATESAIAANSSALRMDYIIQQWNDGIAQVGRTVAWYLYHDDSVVMVFGEEDVVTDLGGDPGSEVLFTGGDNDDASGATFDDLELDIEPYSMERTDQGLKQHQMLQMFGPLPNLIQLIAMFPQGADWADIIDMYGDAFNMPGLGQKIHPEGIAAQVGVQIPAGGSEGPLLASTVGGPAGMPKPSRGAGMAQGASPGMMGQVAAAPLSQAAGV